MTEIRIDGRSLGPPDVLAILENNDYRVVLCEEALSRVRASRQVVEDAIAEGKTIYGVNTGFGKLADQRIPRDQVHALQVNLLRSHACGVGEPLADDVVGLALLFRANALSVGFSGVRPVLIETLLAMFEKGVRPVVPCQGSVGASGDLAPLAHLALPLIGEGFARFRGEVLPGGEAMRRAGVEPIVLEAKEGLALVNGIQITTAISAKTLELADRLLRTADLAAAMSVDALLGTDVAFDPRIHAARPHPGQTISAENVRRLLLGSKIRESHRGPHKVQDAYSLRCVPQVHGAARDALVHARQVVYREVNSATDNPLVFAKEGDVLSGGNFHGEPVALVMDYATLALHELGSIAERRIESMVNPSLSSGLPAFLTGQGGLHSGLMMAQVTAAALVCETRTMCVPGSAESIPTSANQEDHVSLAPLAARKAAKVSGELAWILSIEFLAGARGLDYRKPDLPSAAVQAVYDLIRTRVPGGCEDRPLAPEMAAIRELVVGRKLLAAAEEKAGPIVGI